MSKISRTPDRNRLRRTYFSLGLGEYVAVAVFVMVARMMGRTADNLALWSALIPLLIVLAQSGTYWLLARGWVDRAPMPAGIARLYRVFQAVDPVLLLAGLVGVIVWFPANPLAGAFVVAVWLFGLVEYVNYFVIRLSYPLTTWWRGVRKRRTPRLIVDLRAAR